MRTFKLSPPIVFDTDCLSSFLWVRRPDLIVTVLGGKILLPEQVVYELDNLRPTKFAWVPQMLDQEIAAGAFEVFRIKARGAVATEYLALVGGKYGKRMGSGEAAALAYVRINGGTVASNNLSDIAPYCQIHGLECISTDDILCLAVVQGHLDVAQAETIWLEMKKRKRSLPAYSFSEAFRRFNNNLPK
ncbi:MAG: hypothetical protein K6U03_05790 [Firmicutes bacterium]|nr:hypothetical protein [Bacillota bacterium]